MCSSYRIHNYDSYNVLKIFLEFEHENEIFVIQIGFLNWLYFVVGVGFLKSGIPILDPFLFYIRTRSSSWRV